MTSLLAVLFAASWPSATVLGDDPATKSESKKATGCEVGAEVPAFYVREINSDRPNLAVCLVCKNGDRPVVLISTRKIDRQIERLLEAVDRTVDSHRAEGLRGFAIFLSPATKDTKVLQPQLMTLARDRNLSLPLTIPVESTAGPAALQLPDEVQTTVLLYVDKKIVARSLFKSGELTNEEIDRLVTTAKLLAMNADTATSKGP